MSGKTIGPSLERQMRTVHRRVLGQSANVDARHNIPRFVEPSGFPIHAVILDEKLEKAANFLREPKTAKATVLEWSTETEDYTELDWQLEVWNHDENKEYPKDTPGFAMNISGHYWFFGQCKAMKNREPEEEESP